MEQKYLTKVPLVILADHVLFLHFASVEFTFGTILKMLYPKNASCKTNHTDMKIQNSRTYCIGVNNLFCIQQNSVQYAVPKQELLHEMSLSELPVF
jgi:hypothetical protein